MSKEEVLKLIEEMFEKYMNERDMFYTNGDRSRAQLAEAGLTALARIWHRINDEWS